MQFRKGRTATARHGMAAGSAVGFFLEVRAVEGSCGIPGGLPLRRQKPKAESAASSVHGSAGVWSADAAPHPSADIHASTAREERGFGDSTLRHVFRRYRPAMAGKDMRILAILLLVISVVPGRANEADHLGDHILNCLPIRVGGRHPSQGHVRGDLGQGWQSPVDFRCFLGTSFSRGRDSGTTTLEIGPELLASGHQKETRTAHRGLEQILTRSHLLR